MKKYSLAILISLLFVVYSCQEAYEHPKEVDPTGLNEKIADGMQGNAEWVKSPQTIVKQLLPRDVHQEGIAAYNIKETRFSEKFRKLTIIEEGALDDEILGEKTIIDFELKDGRWAISKMFVALKLRY